jgi:phosphate transport system substrate-binding protein
MKFFDWAYKNGDASATALEYVPLPETVKAAVRSAWHTSIMGPGGKPIF